MKTTLSNSFKSGAISLDLLKTFVVFVQSEGVEAAARSLNVTQASVSQQLQRFEDELGIALFQKSGRRKILTESAKRLSQDLVPPLLQMDRVLREVALKSKDSVDEVVRWVAEPGLLGYASKFRNENVKNSLRMKNFEAGLKEIKNESADFFVSWRGLSERGLHSHVISTEEYCLVWPQKEPFEGSSEDRIQKNTPVIFYDENLWDQFQKSEKIRKQFPWILEKQVDNFFEDWESIADYLKIQKAWSLLPQNWARRLSETHEILNLSEDIFEPLRVYILCLDKVKKSKSKKSTYLNFFAESTKLTQE